MVYAKCFVVVYLKLGSRVAGRFGKQFRSQILRAF
jgi:hypothetical protein